MLQNRSKFHPNPLTHFLTLHHQQQMAHNDSALNRLAVVQQHHINQEQQQQRIPQQLSNHLNHHCHYQLNQQQLNSSHSHLMDASTSLEAGKSFTIAAILGLQKSAIDNSCKDNNNVINLSLSNSSIGNINNIYQQSALNHSKIENYTIKNTNNGKVTCNNNCNTSCLQAFDCDSTSTINTIGRYLPTVSTNSSAAKTSPFGLSTVHQQQQKNAAPHLRVNSFSAAAAVAAAAAVNASNGAPNALQSLQQLHQHHAQQSILSFQRDKLKSDSCSKKSALKNKRVRTIFTPEQLERLEAEFERQQYMVGPERLYLAHTLQLTEAQVKVWFQNRRIKWRKHHLEITQQRLALLRQSQVNAPTVPNTTPTTPTYDDADDFKTNESINEIVSHSRQDSDSDLSICNDSNDGDSLMDGEET